MDAQKASKAQESNFNSHAFRFPIYATEAAGAGPYVIEGGEVLVVISHKLMDQDTFGNFALPIDGAEHLIELLTSAVSQAKERQNSSAN